MQSKVFNLNKNLDNNTPTIFIKKLKKSSIKKINYISNDAGKVKHFTPAAQE
jgi:hypothetical protein